jgi:hypothetical protein
MKNAMWLALGLVAGILGTYLFLRSYASESFLRKAAEQLEKSHDNDNPEQVGTSLAPLTKPIKYDVAKSLVEKYQSSSLAYDLNLIRTEEGERVRSWVIDLDMFKQTYPNGDYNGLRVYLAEHDVPGRNYHSLVVVGAKHVDNDWVNYLGSDGNVLQYVLPCPDNCNKGDWSLGNEGK